MLRKGAQPNAFCFACLKQVYARHTRALKNPVQFCACTNPQGGGACSACVRATYACTRLPAFDRMRFGCTIPPCHGIIGTVYPGVGMLKRGCAHGGSRSPAAGCTGIRRYDGRQISRAGGHAQAARTASSPPAAARCRGRPHAAAGGSRWHGGNAHNSPRPARAAAKRAGTHHGLSRARRTQPLAQPNRIACSAAGASRMATCGFAARAAGSRARCHPAGSPCAAACTA